jgi:hypothetical protein
VPGKAVSRAGGISCADTKAEKIENGAKTKRSFMPTPKYAFHGHAEICVKVLVAIGQFYGED